MPADDAQRRADAALRRGQVANATIKPGGNNVEIFGSGIGAAWSSFVSFNAGALIPCCRSCSDCRASTRWRCPRCSPGSR